MYVCVGTPSLKMWVKVVSAQEVFYFNEQVSAYQWDFIPIRWLQVFHDFYEKFYLEIVIAVGNRNL